MAKNIVSHHSTTETTIGMDRGGQISTGVQTPGTLDNVGQYISDHATEFVGGGALAVALVASYLVYQKWFKTVDNKTDNINHREEGNNPERRRGQTIPSIQKTTSDCIKTVWEKKWIQMAAGAAGAFAFSQIPLLGNWGPVLPAGYMMGRSFLAAHLDKGDKDKKEVTSAKEHFARAILWTLGAALCEVDSIPETAVFAAGVEAVSTFFDLRNEKKAAAREAKERAKETNAETKQGEQQQIQNNFRERELNISETQAEAAVITAKNLANNGNNAPTSAKLKKTPAGL